MSEVSQIVKAGDSTDIGQAMQNLIQDNLARLNVCFLAKVQSVDKNKVDVVQLITTSENEKLVIPSLLVGLPQSKDLQINLKIAEGDVGICVVCDADISGYKQSGDSSKPMSDRTHNFIDSIFIPLSLFNSNIEKSGIVASADFAISAKGDFGIEANLLSLKSKTASLKSVLGELSDYITQIVTTGGYSLTPDATAKFTAWKQNLDTLFKE